MLMEIYKGAGYAIGLHIPSILSMDFLKEKKRHYLATCNHRELVRLMRAYHVKTIPCADLDY